MKFGERITAIHDASTVRRRIGSCEPSPKEFIFERFRRRSLKARDRWAMAPAMRVRPVGAYFAADDPAVVWSRHGCPAEVTHMHAEGIARAAATSLAAAWALRHAPVREDRWHAEMLDFVIDHTPDSLTRAGLLHAREFQPTCSVITAAAVLGSGSKVTCPDTVPFALWCASHTMHDYGEESLWRTVSGGGDRDTTCAIVSSCGPPFLPQPVPSPPRRLANAADRAARFYYDRGKASADGGQFEQAIVDFNEAIRLDPKNSRVPRSRCGLAYELDRAIADLDHAIRLDPTGCDGL